MGTETSPVNAPLGSQCAFCPPSATRLSRITPPTDSSAVKGGQSTVSAGVVSWTMRLTSEARATASSRDLFIFQFPATIGLRNT